MMAPVDSPTKPIVAGQAVIAGSRAHQLHLDLLFGILLFLGLDD
jgi:hypothetical protein